jgi:hypothetical protein
MTQKSTLTRNSPLLAFATAAVVFLITFLTLAGPRWAEAIYRLLVEGAAIGLWLIGATGIGWFALKLFTNPDQKLADLPLKLIAAAALGLGILSLAIFFLSLTGCLNRFTALALLSMGLILILIAGRNQHHPSLHDFSTPEATWHWLLILLAPLWAITILGDLIPPGLLWGDEPNGYDVVEYHLQVPREWFEAGKMIPLHHNVFSFMPFNVEMHYLLAMEIRGGPWAGMYLAQLMHAAMCVLTLLAIYTLLGGGARGALVAILAAAVPWISLLAAVAYNEGGMLLWGTLAIGWAMRARDTRQFALAGIFAGLAAGAKYPVIPLLFVGIPIALFLAGKFHKSPIRIKDILIYLLVAFIALSPWLIRNTIWTGNPVFPQAMKSLGQAHFSNIQVERWREAYLPSEEYRSILGPLKALGKEVITDNRFGELLIPLGIVAAIFSKARRETLFLIILLLIQTFVWLCFTHLQSRFMVMAIPICALLIAQFDQPTWRWTVAAVAIAMSSITTRFITTKLSRYIQADRQIGLIGRENYDLFNTLDMTKLPKDASINLIGDARAFEYQIPMTRLHYKTVFDVDTTDQTKTIEQDWLAGMPPATIDYPDYSELNRFAKTYYAIPPASVPDDSPN